MAVRKERTRWRDQRISERHRKWGFHCPMVDIDFLVVEYYFSEPKAIIEYKHENAKVNFTKRNEGGMSCHSYSVLEKVGTALEIPFLVVRYADDFSNWHITPMNSKAKEVNIKKEKLTEVEYVEFLYNIRGRTLPEELEKIIEKYRYKGGSKEVLA